MSTLPDQLPRKKQLLIRKLELAGADATLLPLSFAEERLWFLQQLDPANYCYNVCGVVQLTGTLDVALLESSLNHLIERHEVLRTSYVEFDGEPIRIIDETVVSPLLVTNLESQAEESRLDLARRLIAAEVAKPIDLSEPPLLRFRLFRLNPHEHVLAVLAHHIVCDDWSLEIMIRELAMLYGSAGKPVLDELPIQYADYAAWEREYLAGDVLDRSREYWLKQLAEPPAALQLAIRAPGATDSAFSAAAEFLELPEDLVRELAALANRENITLFTLLLAAYETLLHRYSGRDDFVVGSPFSTRDRSDTENLVGFFVNIMPLRADLKGDPTFREVMRRAGQTTLEAYEHHRLPFAELVKDLQSSRDLSHSPLFQVTLALHTLPVQKFSLPQLTLTPLDFDPGTGVYDLNLLMRRDGDRLTGVMRYKTASFESATIKRLLGHFSALLEGVVSNPDTRISRLPILTRAELDQILIEWNSNDKFYDASPTIHQLFEAQAARTPDNIAVWSESYSLTYDQLNRRANKLARRLQSLGVEAEVPVAILLERSPEMIVSIFAVLKAGGVYVPLDPTYPADRLAWMLSDAAAPVLLTEQSAPQILAPHEPQVVYLDSDWETDDLLDENPVSNATGDNLVYIIYTSGSTGNPKGVMLTHAGIRNRMCSMQDEYSLDHTDRLLQKTTFSFDVSVWEIFWPLLNGAATVLARPGGQQDPSYLVQLIDRAKVTMLHFIPPMLQVFLQEDGLAACGSLRNVACGGELLPLQLQREFFSKISARLHNHYGPTEGSIEVTTWTCPPDGDLPMAPIGRPIRNIRVYVADSQLQLVPVGVPGELCFSGVGVARGYLNRPDLTAERFVPDPFSGQLGSRLYLTGDRVRLLPSGEIEFLGRVDHQIKVRGFRIEPGEVQATLNQYPGVRESVVMVREDSPGDRRLVAYVIAAPAQRPDGDSLRKHAKEKLPDHMVPAAFVVLDEMPVTSTGKIDRARLPAPAKVKSEDAQTSRAPLTETETKLAKIWAEVLKVDEVDSSDNFFELGGYSLIATQLLSRVRQTFKIDLSLPVIFQKPVLADFAQEVDNARASSGKEELSPIKRIEAGASPLQLSFGQERLWFLEQFEPRNPVYNLATAVRLTGELNRDALEHAFTRIVERHHVLRTTFENKDGRPVQIVQPPRAIVLPFSDLSELPPAQQQAELGRKIDEEAQHIFDLAKGPLLRLSLLKVSDREHVVTIIIHHIVADAWSVKVLANEVMQFYSHLNDGAPVSLPALQIQYADFAGWQRERLSGKLLDAQLDYWKEQLGSSDFPVLALPTDFTRPAIRTHRGAIRSLTLPDSLYDALRELARAEETTLFVTLLAAFELLLHRYSGQTQFVVGVPVANRGQMEVEPLVGFFANTLPLRVDLSGSRDFRTLLAQVRATTLAALNHQDLPFERLVEALHPERVGTYTPLFQVMFALEEGWTSNVAIPGLTLSQLDVHNGGAKFDLSLRMVEDAQSLTAVVEYDTALFAASTIERWLGHWNVLLTSVTLNPAQAISDVAILTDAERYQLLFGFNQTAIPADSASVIRLFEAQAERTPEAIALTFNDRQLNYRTLDDCTNKLCRQLREQSVGPGNFVGIFMERSVEMVVAILATLKAGAAYVPLDPALPLGRINFIAETVDISLLLTHAAVEVPATIPWRSLAVDSEQYLNSAEFAGDPVVDVSPDNLAYVIFTSGSTGQPKAVGVPHGALSNHTLWMQSEFPLSAQDAILQKTPFGFDASVWEFFAPLVAGGRLVMARPHSHKDPSQLVEQIRTHHVTRIQLVPSMLRLLLEEPGFKDCRDLDHVFCGGEMLSEDLAKELLKQLDVKLHNLYGPAEACIDATCSTASREHDENATTIGLPIHNVYAYVLDSNLQLAPVGVTGELFIGGAGLASGYLGRPDLTAESFCPDPWSNQAGARIYRTGDLARRRSDGQLEFLGRVDGQVKLRGFRIELQEVALAVARHSSVHDAAALVKRSGDDRLVCFVATDDVLTAAELRDFLSDKLPEYMIPSAFVFVATLPHLDNGKVDTRALESFDVAAELAMPAYVEARNPLERELVEIWKELLEIERVGVHLNFFDAGGYSLLAIRLLSHIRKNIEVELSLRDLFAAPTIESLALMIARKQVERQNSEQVRKALDQLDQMSEEAAAALLNNSAATPGLIQS